MREGSKCFPSSRRIHHVLYRLNRDRISFVLFDITCSAIDNFTSHRNYRNNNKGDNINNRQRTPLGVGRFEFVWWVRLRGTHGIRVFVLKT